MDARLKYKISQIYKQFEDEKGSEIDKGHENHRNKGCSQNLKKVLVQERKEIKFTAILPETIIEALHEEDESPDPSTNTSPEKLHEKFIEDAQYQTNRIDFFINPMRSSPLIPFENCLDTNPSSKIPANSLDSPSPSQRLHKEMQSNNEILYNSALLTDAFGFYPIDHQIDSELQSSGTMITSFSDEIFENDPQYSCLLPKAGVVCEFSGKRLVFECEFSVQYETKYGERIVMVGSCAELGMWNPESGFELVWGPGHVWRGRLIVRSLPFEYKYVCISSSVFLWENGENRKLDKFHYSVSDTWKLI